MKRWVKRRDARLVGTTQVLGIVSMLNQGAGPFRKARLVRIGWTISHRRHRLIRCAKIAVSSGLNRIKNAGVSVNRDTQWKDIVKHGRQSRTRKRGERGRPRRRNAIAVSIMRGMIGVCLILASYIIMNVKTGRRKWYCRPRRLPPLSVH